MTSVDFGYAPPPTDANGLPIVPLHIVGVRARVEFDVQRSRAMVDAVMDYVVGPASGYPFFDLRQPVHRCWLDGREIRPASLVVRRVGPANIRIVEIPQTPRSRHRLRLRYRMGTPRADMGGSYPPVLAWLPGERVRWSLGMADLHEGRYLESWLPSNLPFDHFPLHLDLIVAGTRVPHSVVSNGDVRANGLNTWSIHFPSWYTTMSALIELHAADSIRTASSAVTLPRSRRPITVEVSKFTSVPEDLTRVLAEVTALLVHHEVRYGDFTGRKYVCFLHDARGGMEYAHATTTSAGAIAHELFHSWFARGVTPAGQADGWWDEGLARFYEKGGAPLPFDFSNQPVELCSRDPFQRTTPVISYEDGSRFFSGVAALIGPDRLDMLLSDLFIARRGVSVSTARLEEHLVTGSGQLGLVDAFHRFVYGLPDPVPAAGLFFTNSHVHGDRIHVRLSNRVDAGICRHFVIAITIGDPGEHRATAQLPIVASAAGFDLAPGETRTVSITLHSPADGATPSQRLVAVAYARGLASAAILVCGPA